MKFEQLLARNVRGFWATSYSFGLKLFDQYLLRKLSQNILNAVILADHDKVADVWEHLPAHERYLAQRAGSRYLLRGVRPVGGGAFHPKTYLFVRGDEATLLVGSGNLTRDGIDRGREVFTSFSTAREQDLPSLRAWAAWMSRLVKGQDDLLLRERWTVLRETCPWMTGSADGSAFLVNDERTLLAQLAERLPESVQELHVTAPFFDRHAAALDDVIRAADAARVVLYVGAGVKVDGPSLATVLARARDVTVLEYAPRTFVHAKLIGAVGAAGDGVLLSGSPNLSGAALTRTSVDEYGNVEAAVVREGAGDDARAVFAGSGLSLIERPLSSLADFEFEDDHPTLSRPLVLHSAVWRGDGRIALNWSGSARLPDRVTLRWDEEASGVPINEHLTSEPVDERDPLPLICWLTDGADQPISNRVALDDPAALREALTVSERKSSSRPSELEGLEMVPLVRLALWAHDKFIFDLDDTTAMRRANDAAAEEQSGEEVSAFWNLYAREELEYDARVLAYRPLTAGSGGAPGPVDELLRELQMLLHASPDAPHPVLRVLSAGGQGPEGDREPRVRTPWTMDARQRVRAYNLVTRWCDAVADPRHALVADEAPVVNYQTLLGVILLAWIHDALDEKHLRRLLLKLFVAFIGSAPGQGFIGRTNDTTRDVVLARLDPFLVEVAAGLAAAALAPHSAWREDIYAWQPPLARGIEYGVVLPGEWSAVVFERATGDAATTHELDQLLTSRLDYLDDETWAKRIADELELERVSLDLHRQSTVSAGLEVVGPSDPLHDVRLLTSARRAIDFKRLPAIAVNCADCVMVLEPGTKARARIAGITLISRGPVDAARLKEIEQQGGSWADILDAEQDGFRRSHERLAG